VQEGPAHVEVLPRARTQQQGRSQVGRKPDERGPDDDGALDGFGVLQAAPAFDQDIEAGPEEQRHVQDGAQHFQAPVAEGLLQRRAAPPDAQGRVADQHGDEIHQVVQRVAHQGQAAAEDPPGDLDGRDDQVHDHGGDQPPAPGNVRGIGMVMMMRHGRYPFASQSLGTIRTGRTWCRDTYSASLPV